MGTEIKKALEQEVERQGKIYESLRTRLIKLKDKEEIPVLKKKYEGKYFKNRNQYNDNEQWWMYLKCTKVINNRKFIAHVFQSCTDKNEFQINSNMWSYSFLETEITKTEYKRALKKFKSKLRLL